MPLPPERAGPQERAGPPEPVRPTGQPRAAVAEKAALAHYPPGATFGPRTLRDFEFVWLLSGRARWVGDGRSVALTPGTLLLGRPGVRDRYDWAEEEPSTHAYVYFRVVDLGSLPDVAEWPLIRDLSSDGPLAALCTYLVWLGRVSAPVDRTNDVVGWLLDLHVRGPLPSAQDTGNLPVRLRALADRVRENWRDGRTSGFTLAELAAAARLSPGHLSRLFRHRYGIGPVAAFERIRLARAARLLLRSELSVSAIAESCGFGDPYHFSRRFRSSYGIPPRSFRHAHSDGAPPDPIVDPRLLELAYAVLP